MPLAPALVAAALFLAGCADDVVIPEEDDPTACGPVHVGTYTGNYSYYHHSIIQGTSYYQDTTFQAVQIVTAPEGSEIQQRAVSFEGGPPSFRLTTENTFILLWDGLGQRYEGSTSSSMVFFSTCQDSVRFDARTPGTNHYSHIIFEGVRQH